MLQKINFPKLVLFAVIGGVIIGLTFYFLEKQWSIPTYYRSAAIIALVIFGVLNLNKYFLKR
jgi:hypothetical protein